MMRFRKNDYTRYMPPLEAIQLNEDGTMQDNVNYQPQRNVTFKDKLTNALLGVQAAPTDAIGLGNGGTVTRKDELTGEDVVYNPSNSSTISDNPRVGGLLNDLASGYRENYNNRFSFNNLGNNDIDFDRKKGFGYRLGEGLGTVGRFIDSPLGRFALAAGLNSALGYNNSLQEGLTAAVGRQNAQTADRVYRQQLMRDYGYTEDDLANVTGNIDSTMFNNLTKSQNSAMNLAIRQQTAQSLNKLRELQAEKQKIINSTLPEMEKAKLIQELAKAEHAEEMQLAKIKFYENSANLGWANFGLKQDAFEDKKNKEKEEKVQSEQFNKDLGEYSSIMKGNDAKKVRYARQKFIELYGKDPDKLLEW